MEMDLGPASAKYLWLYIGLTIILAGLTFAGNLTLTTFALSSSKTLHNSMLNALLKTKMLFFETTPQGRIINRLSKDTDAIDTNLLRFS